jgi:hypothetical protein
MEKMTATYIVSDEAIVDYQIGTLEQQQAAAGRLAIRDAEFHAWLNAQPWHWRLRKAWRRWTHEPRHRLTHATSALRGIECERD